MLLHRVPFRLHPRLFFWLRVGYGMDGRDCAARPDAGVLGWLLHPDRLWRGLARLASVTPVIPLVPSQLPSVCGTAKPRRLLRKTPNSLERRRACVAMFQGFVR